MHQQCFTDGPNCFEEGSKGSPRVAEIDAQNVSAVIHAHTWTHKLYVDEKRQNEEGGLSKSLLVRSYSLPYMHTVIRACYRVAERLESRWDSRLRGLPTTCHTLVTVRIPTGPTRPLYGYALIFRDPLVLVDHLRHWEVVNNF